MKRTDDFFGDLEAQLDAAAHARAAGTLRRRPPAWVRPAVGFAAACALIVALGFGAAALRGADSTGELGAPGPTPTAYTPSIAPASTAPDGSPNPAVDCAVTNELRDRYPAIEKPPERPEEQLPDLVMAKVRTDWRYPDLALARRLPADDGDAGWTFYAIPIGNCPEKQLDGPQDVVAIYAFRDGTYEVSGVLVRDAPPDDSIGVLPAGDRFVVIGSAPADAERVSLDFGTAGVAGVTARDGIVAGLLPVEVTARSARSGDFEVRFFGADDQPLGESAPEDDTAEEIDPSDPDGNGTTDEEYDPEVVSTDERPIVILNGTSVPGLGERIRRDLSDLWNVVDVGNAPDPDTKTSTVYFTEDIDKDTAREVARELGIDRIAAMEPKVADAADGEAVVVVVGRDLAG